MTDLETKAQSVVLAALAWSDARREVMAWGGQGNFAALFEALATCEANLQRAVAELEANP